MNTKRQTIWLVSMLSLMVVLSAYYLFTEDATPTDTAESNPEHTMVMDGSSDVLDAPQVQILPVTEAETSNGISEETQQMLDQIEAEGVMSRSIIDEKLMENQMKYQQEAEELYATINDASVKDENLLSAYDELTMLEDREERIANLEEQLQRDYNYPVVITRDEQNKYQVLVQSAQLEVKQAVDIMGKLMKELDVTQDKVSVQFVSDNTQ